MNNTFLLFLLSIALCLAKGQDGYNDAPQATQEEPEYNDAPQEPTEEEDDCGCDEEEPQEPEPSYEEPTPQPTNAQYSSPQPTNAAPVTPAGSCPKGQWQCRSVSTDYNFVKCSDAKCFCRDDQGFSGSATVANPCFCRAGASLFWRDNLAYCLNSSQIAYCAAQQLPAVTSVIPTSRCAHQWDCSAFSKDYNFVGCLPTSGSLFCQCDRRAGFTGAATKESPCICGSPKQVVWITNKPYCLDIRTCISGKLPEPEPTTQYAEPPTAQQPTSGYNSK